LGNTVDLIKAPIAEEMKLFEQKFFESMKSNVSLLDRITNYIVRRKGKQMRPMFVFLTAKLNGEVQERTYRATKNKDFDLLEVVSVAIQEISEGELLQIEKARKLDITEDVYFEIIRMKTATLIAACCEAGARSVGCSEEVAKKMHRFGELVGIAFQIKDDLFDYTTSNAIGKPVGIDIKEQKMTLPLIYTTMTKNVYEKLFSM
jgi:octaprenyl-diphosphate synthase